MVACDFIEALTTAEVACAGAVGELLGGETFRSANPGLPDCNVFDIGHLMTGDCATFDAASYHWRASLEVYRRDRTALQRDIMRLVAALPVNDDNNVEASLRESSNVQVMRIAPEPRAISEITVTNVSADRDARPVPTYIATLALDVVFRARF